MSSFHFAILDLFLSFFIESFFIIFNFHSFSYFDYFSSFSKVDKDKVIGTFTVAGRTNTHVNQLDFS